MIKKAITILLASISIMSCKDVPITMNLYYSGENGKVRKFVEEMIYSGTVDAIRAEEGNLRYDYFFSKDDPETVLLIDSWANQEALDAHHQTPMMGTISALREKYDLTMRAERYHRATEDLTANDAKYIRTNNSTMEYKTVDFTVWPKGEPNSAYAQYFTGNSYLAPMEGGFTNVTFEPGCRNNWHIHHKQVQVLICVSGRGWYQEWGREAVEMTPGTIIAIPAEVKHWHGAAKDSWFQHLTYHTDVQEGATNEWLEPVTDDQYNAL
ncbi:MAG: antibiotic biosynthesis monooxygenase [Bacteroidales bacterium]|nr:antibiotic biosynthesis monooxygenase [Bacteroidales bacterium]